MFRVTHIRTKLAVLLSVPLLGVLALAGAAARASGVAVQVSPLLVATVALVAIAVTIALAWLGGRWIARPLTSLLDHAEDVAQTWLPNAVGQILDTPSGADLVVPTVPAPPVRSRDEARRLAGLLGSIQASTLELAAEQVMLRRSTAESFLNLGRRNQNLLTRQIDFITELERNESDPDTLEGLFRLDHLATRMRRNAESLLLLAGVESPRQWSAPFKVGDVVRAALGEVEDYQRVVVRHLEPAEVLGPVAAEIAHLTAELVENALSFSPPDQQVEIKGRLTVGGYTLAITDNGHGMTPVEIEQANQRLAEPEAFSVAPSRYLGHLVAAHLARRLGATVTLHDSPAGGLTARVELPIAVLANEELDPRLQAGPPPLADSAPSAGPTVPDAPMSTLDAERDRPLVAAPVELPSDEQAAIPAGRAAEPGEPPSEAESADPSTGVEPAERPPAHLARRRDEPIPERGFGGLAVARPPGPSMHTLAAKRAREAVAGSESTTAAGLPRRVPGAQRPDEAADSAVRRSEQSEVEAPRSTAEDVYSFLSSFQSGVDRGREASDLNDIAPSEPVIGDDR